MSQGCRNLVWLCAASVQSTLGLIVLGGASLGALFTIITDVRHGRALVCSLFMLLIIGTLTLAGTVGVFWYFAGLAQSGQPIIQLHEGKRMHHPSSETNAPSVCACPDCASTRVKTSIGRFLLAEPQAVIFEPGHVIFKLGIVAAGLGGMLIVALLKVGLLPALILGTMLFLYGRQVRRLAQVARRGSLYMQRLYTAMDHCR